MTTLLEGPAPPNAAPSRADLAVRYRRRAGRRRLAVDALVVAAWLVVAIPISIWLASHGWEAMTASIAGAVTGVGILLGLVGTSATVLMLWLSARVPFIDRAIGHDRALALHANLGQLTFLALLLHGVLLVIGYALADQTGWLAELATLWSTTDFVLAVASIVALTAVAVSSVVAARRRLPQEAWHGIHLLTYAAVLLALPHQFSLSGLFVEGPAHWFWAGLWTATFFVLLTYRVFLPAAVSLEHRLVVTHVGWETHDTVSIQMTGRHIDRLAVHGGQFLNWRFLAPGLWWHQHPFSLSAVPRGNTVRITVRELGEGSRRLTRKLRPGTRVAIEGPYGVFTDAARTSPDVVLVGVGIGVAPIRALLEETPFAPGRGTVVLRASTLADVPLLGEFKAWCDHRGARLVVLTGRRGASHDGSSSWLPAAHAGHNLTDLVGDVSQADVYVCGPRPAADKVLADAAACGVPAGRLHNEGFSW